MRKHSVYINGHRTSVTLEDEFWEALKSIAHEQALSVASLIASIDRERGNHNLSSAIRIYILNALLQKHSYSRLNRL